MNGYGHFGGGTSFMSNGYVVYPGGLQGQEPNPYAVKQGNSYIDKMFYIRSTDVRSSFYQFIEYLKALGDQEAAKEQAYLQQKINTMYNYDYPRNYLKELQRLVDQQDFSGAFTLLQRQDATLKTLRQEINSDKFKSFSKTNEFWKSQFYQYIQQRMSHYLSIKNDRLVGRLSANSDISIDSIVDDYMDMMLGGKNGIIADSYTEISNQFKEQLKSLFVRNGILPDDFKLDAALFTRNHDFTNLVNNKTVKRKKGKKANRTVKSMTEDIAEAILKSVAKGMSTEVLVGAQAGTKKGNQAIFNTGMLTQSIHNELSGQYENTRSTTDTVQMEVFSADIDMQAIVNDVFNQLGSDTSVEELRERIIATSKFAPEEIFEIQYNVKGYTSNNNLQIKSGKFRDRFNNLLTMSKAAGMPDFSMQKLIFMINNTVEGALNENRKEYVAQYIAAICVGWLWNDYSEMFNLADAVDNHTTTTRLHLFNSGTAYFTASGILRETAQSLLNNNKDMHSIVNVDINGVSLSNVDSCYGRLLNQYPLTGVNGFGDYAGILTQRWDSLRDYVEAHSTINIEFRQSELDRLLGNLKMII